MKAQGSKHPGFEDLEAVFPIEKYITVKGCHQAPIIRVAVCRRMPDRPTVRTASFSLSQPSRDVAFSVLPHYRFFILRSVPPSLSIRSTPYYCCDLLVCTRTVHCRGTCTCICMTAITRILLRIPRSLLLSRMLRISAKRNI